MNRIAREFESELKDSGRFDEICSLNAYVGDIHNHSGISYGYGKLEDAIAFAQAQLDFFSVTGHFAWPDMEEDGSMMIPEDVVAYHKAGFAKLRRNWPHYLECMAKCSIPSFPSYEYHSFHYGDYTVLCFDPGEEIPPEVEEETHDDRLETLLKGDEEQRRRFLCTPHHIGYKTGYRGINWDEFNEAVSPLVEIVSMHGAAESFESRLKYLHTMGPKSGRNTYQGGLGCGYHFGVVGSTDHHNSAPGSYGSGRTVLFAKDNSRKAIWAALVDRATSAATGDPIEAMLFVNGARCGTIAPLHDGVIDIEAYVASYDALASVEVVQDGKVILSLSEFPCKDDDLYKGSLFFMFGWGKKHMSTPWDIRLEVENGLIEKVSPRFRGVDMVDPLDVPEGSALPSLSTCGNEVSVHVVTGGNTTATTDSTQGFVIELDGNEDTVLKLSIDACWNGNNVHKEYRLGIDELRGGQFTDYISGFVSPAFEIGQFRRRGECKACIKKTIRTTSQGAVYLRCHQKNGDALYTSPVSFRRNHD